MLKAANWLWMIVDFKSTVLDQPLDLQSRVALSRCFLSYLTGKTKVNGELSFHVEIGDGLL
jgi:hypothetical protein